MSKKAKRYLMLLAALGIIAVAFGGGSGTFASFDAQVTNAGNTFQTGTLYLHQTQNSGNLCKSETDATNNHNSACTVVFNIPNAVLGAQTAKVEINNAGTIPASNIMFNVGNCSITTGSGTNTFGTSPTCANMFITIQETTGIGGTNLYCALGTDTTGTCAAPSSAITLTSATTPVALKTTAAATATLAAAATRDYIVTIAPDSTLTPSNVWQNRKVSFDLTWQINQ